MVLESTALAPVLMKPLDKGGVSSLFKNKLHTTSSFFFQFSLMFPFCPMQDTTQHLVSLFGLLWTVMFVSTLFIYDHGTFEGILRNALPFGFD